MKAIAIVSRPKPLTEDDRVTVREWKWEFDLSDYKTARLAQDPYYTLCVVEMVAAGKKLKWVIVEEIEQITDTRDLFGGYATKMRLRSAYFFGIARKKGFDFPMLERYNDEGIIDCIENKEIVSKKHIQHLFPHAPRMQMHPLYDWVKEQVGIG